MVKKDSIQKRKRMIRNKENNLFERAGVWIQECIVLLASFFYILYQIRPVLIIESQSPVFLYGADFLSEFLKIPGGLTDWISAYCMQFWFSDFYGAVFLTVCFWMVAFLTGKWIETLTKSRPILTFHLIPVGFLLALQNQYDFRLSIIMALIFNLSVLILFIRWAPQHHVVRTITGLAISVLLYYTTGGAFLMFTVLCGLDDLLHRRQILHGLVLLLISLVLPFAASASVFIVTVKQAYVHNLIFDCPIKYWIVEYGFPAFFLLMLLFNSIGFSGIRKIF
jgi:hypothetical protein